MADRTATTEPDRRLVRSRVRRAVTIVITIEATTGVTIEIVTGHVTDRGRAIARETATDRVLETETTSTNEG